MRLNAIFFTQTILTVFSVRSLCFDLGENVQEVFGDTFNPDSSIKKIEEQHIWPTELALGFTDPDACTVKDGCDNTYSVISNLNSKLREPLSELIKSDFFRFFKLQLYKSCPFWPENPMCFSPSCAVEVKDDVDYIDWDRVDNDSALVEFNCDYCNTDEEHQDDAVFVDLTLNPERYSGYSGEETTRIWSAIYQENCFNKPNPELYENEIDETSPLNFLSNKYFNLLASWTSRLSGGEKITNYDLVSQLMNQENDKCIEKRVFYRLISGMHASIATHLSFEWLNTSKKNAKFEPNLELWMQRVGYFSDRLANIYFNYSLVAKALLKLADDLKQIQFSILNKELGLIERIVNILKPYEDHIFDENLVFNYEDELSNTLLKNEFKANFKNVSSLMDCVGCERCRLWGKVQTLGYGTSLKILFELNDDSAPFDIKSLKRTEIIALINTFDRLSKSVAIIDFFRDQWLANSTTDSLKVINGAVSTDEAKLKNEQKVAYQQKIFKQQDVNLEVHSKVEIPQAVKDKNKEESKKVLSDMFKEKKQQFSDKNQRLNEDTTEYPIFLFPDEDSSILDTLTSDEIRYRTIFYETLKLKNSKKMKDKVFRDHVDEVLQEFYDVGKFIWESYIYFPINVAKIVAVELEIKWNRFIGNDDFFNEKKKKMSNVY